MKLLLVWDLFSKYKVKFDLMHRPIICTLIILVGFLSTNLTTSDLYAEVFYAQDEALKLAFPEADKVEKKVFVLTPEQQKKVESIAQTKVESNLFSFYYGYKGEQFLGYAAIDTHSVRTMTETFMVVFTPEGAQRKIVMLAFHEPSEYIGSESWLKQFEGKTLKEDLWPGRAVHGIVGSTLTSQAMASGVRKVLSLYQILILEGAK